MKLISEESLEVRSFGIFLLIEDGVYILLRSGAECRGFLVKGWLLNLLFVSMCLGIWVEKREC